MADTDIYNPDDPLNKLKNLPLPSLRPVTLDQNHTLPIATQAVSPQVSMKPATLDVPQTMRPSTIPTQAPRLASAQLSLPDPNDPRYQPQTARHGIGDVFKAIGIGALSGEGLGRGALDWWNKPKTDAAALLASDTARVTGQQKFADTQGQIDERAAQTERAKAETAKLGAPAQPKLLEGEDNIRTGEDGAREHAYQMGDGSVQWVPEGQSPTAPQRAPLVPSAGPSLGASTLGNVPSLPVTSPNGAPSNQPAPQVPKYTYGKPANTPEGERPLTNVDQMNKALTDRYQVLNPSKPLPGEFTIPAGATQKDYDRIDKALAGVEGAQATQAQRAQVEAIRQQTAANAKNNKANAAGDEFDKVSAQNAAKAVDTAHAADFRLRSMDSSYDSATKDNDQQAMLNLLTNHIGMTLGLQKGARITKDILHEAAASAPWLQTLAAKFDKDGYLSGVVLTKPQMDSMMNLARSQRENAWQQAMDSAKQAGVEEKVKIPDDLKSKFAPSAKGPAVGTVEGGYKFNGGDPSNQKNWTKQ